MPRRRTSKIAWAVLILIVSAGFWFAWEMVLLHVTEPSGPVSAARAESFASISIPATATNIRIAGYHQWIAYEQYVRFEAPVAVCLETAAKVVPDEKLLPVDAERLTSDGRPIRPGVFHDWSWFDLAKATNVVSAGGGPGKPCVWVDQDRGIFYFRLTD